MKITKKIVTIALLIAVQSSCIRVNADPTFVEPMEIKATCYTQGVAGTGTVMANGQTVFHGAIAGKEEWLGMVAYLYEDNDGKIGDWLGCYEFCDTGGTQGIKNGYVIDVYQDSLEDCKDFMAQTNGKVFIQIFDNAKG